MALDPDLVFIVDDNVDTNEALATMLEYRGYRPVCAYDGQDALSQLRSGLRPSVIVLDLAMPNVDGRMFLDEIMTDGQLSGIPVVLYSARWDGSPVHGVAACVAKGQHPDVLLNVIDSLSPHRLVS